MGKQDFLWKKLKNTREKWGTILEMGCYRHKLRLFVSFVTMIAVFFCAADAPAKAFSAYVAYTETLLSASNDACIAAHGYRRAISLDGNFDVNSNSNKCFFAVSVVAGSPYGETPGVGEAVCRKTTSPSLNCTSAPLSLAERTYTGPTSYLLFGAVLLGLGAILHKKLGPGRRVL